MAGSESPHVHLSSPTSRGFSASPVDEDAYGGRYSSSPRFDTSPSASSSRQFEKPDEAGSSNFIRVLKTRVRAVLDAQQNSSSRVSGIGSVSQPTTPTTMQELASHGQQNTQSSYGTPVGQSTRPELQMLPLRSGREPVVVDSGSGSRVRSANLEDYYSIDWMPRELFLKFRQQVEGFQLGANFEVKEYNTKLVFKPVGVDRKWKFIVEPKHGDVRLLTKKIPIGPLLNIQVGIGHEWHNHVTGWKWKVTSAFGGNCHTHIRHKTLFPLTPGFDLRVGWNAEYVLPDLHGALGTGDPTIGLNLGHLYASIERLEAIYTHMT